MADIVLGIWTTHGPQLSTTPEQWMLRVPADRKRKHWFKGKEYSFEELVELRQSENLLEQSSLEVRTRNHVACQSAIARVAAIWKQVNPDVCVVFGNDQRELVLPEMQPAFTIFHGEQFWNGPLPNERAATLPPGIGEAEWANRPKDQPNTKDCRILPRCSSSVDSIAAGISQHRKRGRIILHRTTMWEHRMPLLTSCVA